MSTIPGDPTAQTPPVTTPLASTDPAQLAQSGSTGATGSVSTTPQQPLTDVSAIIAQYENRLRNLMSDKDKAIDERNKAIANLADVQSQFTTLREQTQSSLTGAATAAQQAIDYGKTLEGQLASLKAENTRAKILLQNPDLAPYAQFIPASEDEAKVQTAVEQLKEINKQQLARLVPQVQPQATPPTSPFLQPNVASPNLLDLYQGRPNMAPMLGTSPASTPSLPTIPGSSPAQMNPIATPEDQTKEIQKLFDQARLSGKQEDYDRARDEAILRANAALNAVTGRSS